GLNVGSRRVLTSLGDNTVSTIHSTWIEALLGTGFTGAAFLALAFLTALGAAWRVRRQPVGVAVLGMLVFFCVRSITGPTPELFSYLQDFANRSLEATRLDAFAIKGKKEQSIFDFPDSVDYPGELFDVVSEVCGLDRSAITLSERHIQAYEPNADPEPAPHKDRYG